MYLLIYYMTWDTKSKQYQNKKNISKFTLNKYLVFLFQITWFHDQVTDPVYYEVTLYDIIVLSLNYPLCGDIITFHVAYGLDVHKSLNFITVWDYHKNKCS